MTPEAIKQIRKDKELSQEELAKVLGCSARTIREWESGRSRPSKGTEFMLQRLAAGKDVVPHPEAMERIDWMENVLVQFLDVSPETLQQMSHEDVMQLARWAQAQRTQS